MVGRRSADDGWGDVVFGHQAAHSELGAQRRGVGLAECLSYLGFARPPRYQRGANSSFVIPSSCRLLPVSSISSGFEVEVPRHGGAPSQRERSGVKWICDGGVRSGAERIGRPRHLALNFTSYLRSLAPCSSVKVHHLPPMQPPRGYQRHAFSDKHPASTPGPGG